MSGLEIVPIRAPEKWDAKWFEGFVKDALALADARNIIGVGILVEGSASEKATLTLTGDANMNLPTAATGESGSLWNDGGTVKVVP